MCKQLVLLFIWSLLVLVSSTPTDSAENGGNRSNGGAIQYTESAMPTGTTINTPPNSASQQIEDTHDVKIKASPTTIAGTNTSNMLSQSTPSPIDSNDNKGNETTMAPVVPTTTPPITTSTISPATTTNVTTPSTTTNATTPTTTTTQPTTTTMSPDTPPPPPTTTTLPATTTAAAATTTVPAPTASPSKDRRFDGPSFIGGIVLSLGIMAIGFVAFKFYKARTERNYHTL